MKPTQSAALKSLTLAAALWVVPALGATVSDLLRGEHREASAT